MKNAINIRLSNEALAHLDQHAKARGLTRTAMLEMILRLFAEAERQRIPWPTPPLVTGGHDHH
jgi:predicted transcriptional regulator